MYIDLHGKGVPVLSLSQIASCFGLVLSEFWGRSTILVGTEGRAVFVASPDALELPPTGGQIGCIFALILQASKDLSLHASLPSVTEGGTNRN